MWEEICWRPSISCVGSFQGLWNKGAAGDDQRAQEKVAAGIHQHNGQKANSSFRFIAGGGEPVEWVGCSFPIILTFRQSVVCHALQAIPKTVPGPLASSGSTKKSSPSSSPCLAAYPFDRFDAMPFAVDRFSGLQRATWQFHRDADHSDKKFETSDPCTLGVGGSASSST